MDYLNTSFGLYHSSDLQTTQIPLIKQTNDTILDGATAIGEAILAAAFLGKDSIAWKNIEETSPDNYIVTVMNENFYDGITGMYLYFSELYHVTGKSQFKEPYELAEAMVLKLDEDYAKSISAFFGSLSAVYPLLYTYECNKNKKLLAAAESIAAKYMDDYDKQVIDGYDWNGGIASIVNIFVQLYQLTSKLIYVKFAKQLLNDLDLDKITQGGFAHGYSGVIYAANLVQKVAEDPEIELFIKKCLLKERTLFDLNQKGWLDIRAMPPVINDFWCYGATGIGLAYLDLLNSGFKDQRLPEEIQIAAERLLNQEKRDDCLCHGNFGDLSFLLEYEKTDLVTAKQKEQIQEKLKTIKRQIQDGCYTFEGLPTIPKYGLFTGLSGIGHQLLRMYDPKRTANVLTLGLRNK